MSKEPDFMLGGRLTPFREKLPEDTFLTAYVLRPVMWLTYQFSHEARVLSRIVRESDRRGPR